MLLGLVADMLHYLRLAPFILLACGESDEPNAATSLDLVLPDTRPDVPLDTRVSIDTGPAPAAGFYFECEAQQLDQVTGQGQIRLAFNNTPSGGRDGRDNAHLVWVRTAKLYHGRRTPLAKDWTIAEIPTTGAPGKPTFAMARGNLFLAWDEEDDGGTGDASDDVSRIMLRWSGDQGATWSAEAATVVSVPAAENLGSAGLYATSEGSGVRLVVIYNHGYGEGAAREKKVDVATWSGQLDGTFAATPWTTKRLSESAGDPAVAGRGSFLVAAYETPDFGARHTVGLHRSEDGGASWGNVISIGPTVTGDASLNLGDLSLAVRPRSDGGHDVYLAFQTGVGGTPVFIARSRDAGQTFAAADTLEVDLGFFPMVAVDTTSRLVVGWEWTDGAPDDDSKKRYGLSLTTDDWSTDPAGPDLHPRSTDLGTAYVQIMLAESGAIDTAWIANDRNAQGDIAGRTLWYQRGSFGALASGQTCAP